MHPAGRVQSSHGLERANGQTGHIRPGTIDIANIPPIGLRTKDHTFVMLPYRFRALYQDRGETFY
jgi:hypothetical protein